MSIKGLFVHHIVHPLVMAGKGEPKDAGSLERYHHVVSSVKVYQLEQAQSVLMLGVCEVLAIFPRSRYADLSCNAAYGSSMLFA